MGGRFDAPEPINMNGTSLNSRKEPTLASSNKFWLASIKFKDIYIEF